MLTINCVSSDKVLLIAQELGTRVLIPAFKKVTLPTNFLPVD